LKRKSKKILLVILLVWLSFIITDFTLSKYNKKPIFAIPVYRLNDGGTVEYYGLGYKVIKYNVLDTETEKGRKDTVFGFWTLKYESN
jgi:hypothetical protein